MYEHGAACWLIRISIYREGLTKVESIVKAIVQPEEQATGRA